MATPNREAIQEMIRGREAATRVRCLLSQNSGHGGPELEEAGGLAEEVVKCLSRALSALDSGETSSEVCQDAAAAGAKRPCPDHDRSEGSTGKRKIRVAGERRSGQTRRSQPYAWRRVTSETLNDGHTWRKYGQKEIHGAKHPRCYFRCTHKHDQGCPAARQVQKSEDDPSAYVITYLGHHTCKTPTASLRPGLGPDAGAPFLISFGPPDPPLVAGGGGGPLPGAPAAPSNQENAEDDALSSLSRNDVCSPEYLTLPELVPLEASVPMTGVSSCTASDFGDVTSTGGLHSSCVSPSSMGIDFTGESLQFEDVFGLVHDHEFSYGFY